MLAKIAPSLLRGANELRKVLNGTRGSV